MIKTKPHLTWSERKEPICCIVLEHIPDLFFWTHPVCVPTQCNFQTRVPWWFCIFIHGLGQQTHKCWLNPYVERERQLLDEHHSVGSIGIIAKVELCAKLIWFS